MARKRSNRYEQHIRLRTGRLPAKLEGDTESSLSPANPSEWRGHLQEVNRRSKEVQTEWKGKRRMLALVALVGLIAAMIQVAEDAMGPLLSLWQFVSRLMHLE